MWTITSVEAKSLGSVVYVKKNKITIMIWRLDIHKVVLRLPDSWSNWNLEVLVFEERGKPEYPGEKAQVCTVHENIYDDKISLYQQNFTPLRKSTSFYLD